MKNLRIIFVALFLIAVLTAVAFLPLEQLLTNLQVWVEANDRLAFAAVTLFIAVGFLLMLPASILVMLAGFLFGLRAGFLSAFIAAFFASSLSFWIARSLARQWIERKIIRKPMFTAIDRAIRRKGFLIVLLTRLVMVLPFPAFNYMLGLTSVQFRRYLPATLMGVTPPLFLLVFLGTTAGNIAAIMKGDVTLEENQLLVIIFAVITVVAVVGFIIRKASLVLKEELANTRAPQ